MTVYEIVSTWLKQNEYGGLCKGDCGCGFDAGEGIVPCGGIESDCEPAHANECSTCVIKGSCELACTHDYNIIYRPVRCYVKCHEKKS